MPDLPQSIRKSAPYTAIERFLGRFNIKLTGTVIANILAIVVGALAGLGAVGFRYLIGFFQYMFFDGGEKLFSFMGEYYVVSPEKTKKHNGQGVYMPNGGN